MIQFTEKFIFLSVAFTVLLALSSVSASDSNNSSFLQLYDPLEYGEFIVLNTTDENFQSFTLSRAIIPGMTRIRNLNKIFHTVKVSVNYSDEGNSYRVFRWAPSKAELCFVWNESSSLGEYTSINQWIPLDEKGWSVTLSPFLNRFIDIKTSSSFKGKIDISYNEEFQAFRPILLTIGVSFFAAAPFASSWVPFYYTGGMSVGIVLIVIVFLYQLTRLVPFGGRNVCHLFLVGSVIGLGGFVMAQLSYSARLLLVYLGLSDDLLFATTVVLGSVVVVVGAIFGFFIVRKMVLNPDGSLDKPTTVFVKWLLRFIGVLFLLLSSADVLLSFGVCLATMLVFGVVPNLPFIRVLKFLLSSRKRPPKEIFVHGSFGTQDTHTGEEAGTADHRTPVRTSLRQRMRGSPQVDGVELPASPVTPLHNRADSAYPGVMMSPLMQRPIPSSIHKSPYHKGLSKDEASQLTSETTRILLNQLKGSTEYSKWLEINIPKREEDDDEMEDSDH